jgi:hypothetical protein
MKKRLDINEIAKKNPRVSLEEFRKAQILDKELRDQDAERPGYDLVSPYERRPLHGPNDEAPIHLTG